LKNVHQGTPCLLTIIGTLSFEPSTEAPRLILTWAWHYNVFFKDLSAPAIGGVEAEQ
jgi:hypothetical protein